MKLKQLDIEWCHLDKDAIPAGVVPIPVKRWSKQ